MDLVTVKGVTPMDWTAEHKERIAAFCEITMSRTLFFYIDGPRGFVIEEMAPPHLSVLQVSTE